jgi:hypothetical protein
MAIWEALSCAGVNDGPRTLPRNRLVSASSWGSTQGGLEATGRRVERLRDPVAQIELLPVSPDRLLSEFRCRVVDVDTGVTPRAMLPLREPALAPVPRRPPQRNRAPSITRIALRRCAARFVDGVGPVEFDELRADVQLRQYRRGGRRGVGRHLVRQGVARAGPSPVRVDGADRPAVGDVGGQFRSIERRLRRQDAESVERRRLAEAVVVDRAAGGLVPGECHAP